MMTDMNIEARQVDYDNPVEAGYLFQLLNEYAVEPMGGGSPIDAAKKDEIIRGLKEFPTSFSLILYVDSNPAALANCFYGFSTFAGRPLINIHDLMVSANYRGRGLSTRLLQEIEALARERGCCKLTLEVLSNNDIAKNSYRKFGFEGYELDPNSGEALFWQKKLSE